MKKFCLSVILALAMTMSLTGCSQTPKQEPAKTGDTDVRGVHRHINGHAGSRSASS